MQTTLNRRGLLKTAGAAAVLTTAPGAVKAALMPAGPIRLPAKPYNIESIRFICDQLEAVWRPCVKARGSKSSSLKVPAPGVTSTGKPKYKRVCRDEMKPYYEALDYALHFIRDNFSVKMNIIALKSITSTRKMELIPSLVTRDLYGDMLDRIDALPEAQSLAWHDLPGV